METSHDKSLQGMVNQNGIDIRVVFVHEQMLHSIKNQNSIIKEIFTAENTRILLSYLNCEHEFNPAEKELCYKLPQAAMEIVCCESQHLLEIIFASEHKSISSIVESNNSSNIGSECNNSRKTAELLEYLLEFLDYREHYFLTGLFSKAMSSITKRVFSVSHKYNSVLCEKIFGNPEQSGYLIQTLNHIYSETINELIIRWLTLKGKENDFRTQKEQFLENLISLINVSEGEDPQGVINFGDESLESIVSLIFLLLKSPLEVPPERPQPMEHKNVNLMVNKNSQKELYDLVCQHKFIKEILKPIPNPRIPKLLLVRKLLQTLRTENEQLQKMDEEYANIHLSDVIKDEMLIECLDWVSENLSVLSLKINDSLQSGGQSFEIGINKKLIVAYLELMYELHLLIEELREPLTFYYEQNEKDHVEMITNFLKLNNNIVHNLLNKIILVVLKKLNCPDFETALLHHTIASLIDEEGIREQVLPWAKIILQTQSEKGHIYENASEEAKWDHMSEIISAAEDIVIGKYRYTPSTLEQFYSTEKALGHYSEFLKGSIEIEYEEKIGSKKAESEKGENEKIELEEMRGLKKKLSSPPVFETIKKEQEGPTSLIKIKEEQEQVHLENTTNRSNQFFSIPESSSAPEKQAKRERSESNGLSILKAGYLEFSLEEVLKELEW